MSIETYLSSYLSSYLKMKRDGDEDRFIFIVPPINASNETMKREFSYIHVFVICVK